MMSDRRLVARTVNAALQGGPGASPRELGVAGVCASRVRSRRVCRTLKQNHNESVSFLFTHRRRWREKNKMRFSRKPLVRFSQNFARTCPPYRPTERYHHWPAPRIRGGVRGPQRWGDPKNLPLPVFGGRNVRTCKWALFSLFIVS